MPSRWFLLVVVACSSPTRPPAPANVTTAPARAPAIAIQLAYRGTFVIGPPFSQVPPFTLLDDGTVIVAEDDKPVYTSKLPPDEADRIVRHVRELGFERLENHLDNCKRKSDRSAMCISDASYTILRVALAGKLREVTTYANFSNEPEVHERIVDYLSKYKPANPKPYRPTLGVLHVRVEQDAAKPAKCTPIDPAILRREADQHMWAFKIEGAALDTVLALAPANRQGFFVCAGDVMFQLAFLPAVPGSDLDAELARYRPRR